MRRSLTSRIGWMTSLWAVVATFTVASIFSASYSRTLNRDFRAEVESLVGPISIALFLDGDGMDAGQLDSIYRLLGDSRYQTAGSGWYWLVEPEGEGMPIGSLSAYADAQGNLVEIPVPADAPALGGEDGFQQRSYFTRDETNRLYAFEEGTTDSAGNPVRIRVFGNQSEIDNAAESFYFTLLRSTGAVAAGSALLAIVFVRIGLRPLRQASRQLQEVREGRAEQLDADVPREIHPLVTEVNALIAGNKRIVERARTQVGNLAHGLKTPLSVIMNEGATLAGSTGTLLAEQATRMREQVDAYLDRARIAAGSRAGLTDTDAVATIDRVLRAVRKLAKDKRIEFEAEPGLRFEGEKHDLEEIAGNLVENAAKWSRHSVWVRLEPIDESRFAMVVEDDGPGISADAAARAMKRGVRLDESVEGSGLGLSIVRDIASEYGGAFELERSEAGGLLARVTLPRKHTTKARASARAG